jgi:hypothetical protein
MVKIRLLGGPASGKFVQVPPDAIAFHWRTGLTASPDLGSVYTRRDFYNPFEGDELILWGHQRLSDAEVHSLYVSTLPGYKPGGGPRLTRTTT